MEKILHKNHVPRSRYPTLLFIFLTVDVEIYATFNSSQLRNSIESVRFLLISEMLGLALFWLSERYSFNISEAETSILPLNANDDVFFVTNRKDMAMILHSIQDLIASVNIHDGSSIIQGYIGRESRSFGIYFGRGKGSITIHATGDTNLTYSVREINNSCRNVFISCAPRDIFSLQSETPVLNKKANETIRPGTSVCFWHAAPGGSRVDLDVKIPSTHADTFVSSTTFNSEKGEERRGTHQMKREYNGSFFGLFKAGPKSEGVQVNVIIENTTEFIANPDYHAMFFANREPQFLLDIEHVPDPVTPTKWFPTEAPGSGQSDPYVTAAALAVVWLVCAAVVVFCGIFIYKRRQRRREKEMEAALMSLEDDNAEFRHIPRASIQVPRTEMFDDADCPGV